MTGAIYDSRALSIDAATLQSAWCGADSQQLRCAQELPINSSDLLEPFGSSITATTTIDLLSLTQQGTIFNEVVRAVPTTLVSETPTTLVSETPTTGTITVNVTDTPPTTVIHYIRWIGVGVGVGGAILMVVVGVLMLGIYLCLRKWNHRHPRTRTKRRWTFMGTCEK